MRRFILRRLAWTVLASYILLSAAFFALALTPDPNRLMAEMAAAGAALTNASIVDKQAYIKQAGAAYLDARNKNLPLSLRYWRWISGYTMLDWGWSFAYERPVFAVLADRVPVTAAYIVPAVLLSWVVSLTTGVAAALRGGLADVSGRVLTALGLGLPAVVVVAAMSSYRRVGELSYPTFDPSLSTVAPPNLLALAIPTAIVTVTLIVVQWRAVRGESLDLLDEDFVKRLRASGASRVDLARHLLRNATAPLASLFAAEVTVVVLLTVYVVEIFLGIPGIGQATLVAFEERDIGLVLAAVMLPAYVGLLGNLLADLLAGVVDPRVSE